MNLIAFEGRTVAVMAPEDLEALETENTTLKRQVEVMLVRIDRMGTDCADEEASDACCISCPMRDRDCAVKCIDNMRQWSLEQAKGGAG